MENWSKNALRQRRTTVSEWQMPKTQIILELHWIIEDLTISLGDYQIGFKRIGESPDIEDPEERLRIATANFIPPRGQFHWEIRSERDQTVVAQGRSSDWEKVFEEVKGNLAQLAENHRVRYLKGSVMGKIADGISEGKSKKQIWEETFAPDAPDTGFRGLITREEFDQEYRKARNLLNTRVET